MKTSTLLKIEECLVCSNSMADVLFQPCLHMVVCDGEIKLNITMLFIKCLFVCLLL